MSPKLCVMLGDVYLGKKNGEGLHPPPPPYCTCRIGLAAKVAFSRYPWWWGYSVFFLLSTTASEPQPQARGRSTTFHRLWTPSRLSGLAAGVLRGRRSLQSGRAGFFR